MATLLLSGCTANSRHLHHHPNGLRLDDVAQAGAQHDPLAALLLCQPPRAAFTVVHGRVVVREGRLVTVDLREIVRTHNRLARKLIDGT